MLILYSWNRDLSSLLPRFSELLSSRVSAQLRKEICSTSKWVYDGLAKNTIEASSLYGLCPFIYTWIATCREASIIFELLRLLVMLNESK